jgi:hypothetical protein
VAINGNEASPVLTHSYFIGAEVHERFETDYVFSLSTDADNLYGYENGVLVYGKMQDDFVPENQDEQIPESTWYANFHGRGREWERPLHVETFTASGERIIAQNAGVRVYGNATRNYRQKSLRLTARREYEPTKEAFAYPLFSNYQTANDYKTPFMSYNQLVLRNDGNDWPVSRLRTPLITWIVEEAGFAVVSPYAATAVFINGEYYGYAALHVRIDDNFLQDLFNAPERSFDIIDGGILNVDTEDEAILEEFTQMLKYAADGATDPAMQALEDFFDIENLLFYYAIQTYIGNEDWPDNNVKIWRYTSPSDTANQIKELDGRWRFILFDLEYSLHTLSVYTPDSKSIHKLLEWEDDLLLITALLQNAAFLEKFANYICDLAFEHFAFTNVQGVIEEIDAVSYKEREQTDALYENAYKETGREGHKAGDRDRILYFLADRPAYVLAELCELFGYTEMYRVTSDGTAKINTLNGNEGQYFIENSVPVTPILARGQAFDYWLVNGERRGGEELRVSFADADANGVVHVECVAREDLPPLFFLDTYDNDDLCGFTMYNPTDTVQSTRGLYLSDDIYNLKKWPFPSLNVRPGAVWEFVGQNSTSYDSLLKIGLNFNPRYGEAVFLSNEDGEVLDWLAIER